MTLSLDRQNQYREQYRALHPGWRPATEVYEALIRERLRAGMVVADLGCGRGGVLEQVGVADTLPIGLDPDLQSLREHRQTDIRRAQAAADALPLRASSIDMVLCSWVFEHLETPWQVFGEISRVLQPGGCAIFVTPHVRSMVVALNRTLRPLQRFLVPRLYGRAEADTFPVRYRANSRRQLNTAAAQAGLALAQLRYVADPTYLAFTPLLFKLSAVLSTITSPVHLIGILERG